MIETMMNLIHANVTPDFVLTHFYFVPLGIAAMALWNVYRRVTSRY